MAYTFLKPSEVLTRASDEAITAGVAKSKITALQEPQMVEFFHQLNAEFCFAAHGKHHARGWTWLRKPYNFTTHVNAALSVAVSANASSFSLSSGGSNFADTNGRVAIETTRGGLVFVDFSSRSGNDFTVDSDGLQIGINLGTSRVYEMYKAPTDYGRSHKMWVNSVPYRFTKFMGQFPDRNRYTMLGDFFLFPRGMFAADATLIYEKAPENITGIEQDSDIPRVFQRWAIEMTLFRLFRIRRRRNDLKSTLELADIELNKALNYDATQDSSNHIHLA